MKLDALYESDLEQRCTILDYYETLFCKVSRVLSSETVSFLESMHTPE